MEIFINIDKWLFGLINGQFVNSFFDKFFPYITQIKNWQILFIVLALWLLWKGGKKGRITIIVLGITILAADQISSTFLKNLVERLRPCNDITMTVRLLVDCGPGFSFPSSHAVNTFAAAFVLSRFYHENRYVFYTIAGLISYSRVYVGVHYPADIIAGALLGIIIAYLIVIIYDYVTKKIKTLSV